MACPDQFSDYPGAVADFLNGAGRTPIDLTTWLKGCGAINDNVGGVTLAAIESPNSSDLVVVAHDPQASDLMPKGMLLVYFAGASGYVLAGEADGTGTVAMLRVGDINKNGHPDVVWTDTNCGASTCFSTLYVNSWDGTAFRNWLEGEPTMADAQYSFKDNVLAGSGDEIMAHGGVIASAGAGPQRSWTETYFSPDGGAYRLFAKVYDKPTCLYHVVVEADAFFDDWTQAGFAPAVQAYQQAIADTSLGACGTIENEVTVLRDFARFRLMVAMAGSGKAAQMSKIRQDITTPAILGAANVFVDSYESYGSLIQACRDTTDYAVANPDSWQFMADWGYANPTFKADDLCPLAK